MNSVQIASVSCNLHKLEIVKSATPLANQLESILDKDTKASVSRAVAALDRVDQVTWRNLERRDDGTGTVSADTFAWYAGAVEPSTFGAVLGDGRYLVHAVAATNPVILGTPGVEAR